MDIMIVIETMLKLFTILILGYVLNKTGVFDEHVNKKLSSLIVNLTSPLMVITSVASVSSDSRSSVFALIGAGFVMYGVFVLLGKAVVRILPIDKEDRPVYECMCVLANVAFMGYPVVQSVLGAEAVFYAAMLHLAFSFFVYTYAVLCLTGDKNGLNLKKLLTPGFILVMVAVFIYLFDIRLPGFLASTVEMVGSVTSPLSMMLIGSSLAMYPLKESISDWRCYLFAGIRMLMFPVLTYFVCGFLHVDPYLSSIAILTNGMPVASMVLMLATQYDANKEIVTRNIIVSTCFSVISIPLVVFFLL